MLKYFGYRKGIKHLHVTQILNTLSLMRKLINLGGFFKIFWFLINFKTRRFIIQVNNREIGHLVMQYQNPLDVSFCDSTPQFIPFLVREHPEKSLESCFLDFILQKLQVFLIVFPPLLLTNKKTLSVLFNATFRTVWSFYIEPLISFSFFFFSIFCILSLRTDQFVNVTTQIPNWDKTGHSQFYAAFWAYFKLVPNSQELRCMGEEPVARMQNKFALTNWQIIDSFMPCLAKQL